MIQIESLDIKIRAYKAIHNDGQREFGRHIEFKKGLNIVVGDNTTGKTTLVKCLFYALGMEELFSNHKGKNSLDKSVCNSFDVSEGGKMEQCIVASSYVECTLKNTRGSCIRLKRWIVSPNDEKEQNIINVINDDYAKDLKWKQYFIHLQNDHDENSLVGFYQYLAKFADIPLVDVPNYKGEQVQLYMQTIFSLSFIEQTRGWSDFFSTIKGYHVVQPRQRIIEYALNLMPDTALSVNRAKKDEMSKLQKNLVNSLEQFQKWLALNNMRLSSTNIGSLEKGISLDNVKLLLIDQRTDLSKELERGMTQISELRNKYSVSHLSSNIEEEKTRLSQLEAKRNEFITKLIADKAELEELKRRKENVDNERMRIQSITKVRNTIHLMDVKECPFCHQHLPVNQNVCRQAIDVSTIQNDLQELSIERTFLNSMIKSLEVSIGQQEIYLMYYDREVTMQKTLCDSLYNRYGIVDNSFPSEKHYELAKLEMKVSLWQSVIENFQKFKDSLYEMEKKYKEIEDNLETETDTALTNSYITHKSTFKQLLSSFGYNSNNLNCVFLCDRNGSDKFLPEVQLPEGTNPIRNVSSASDFIRSIWAYYLSLLKNAVRHPGFLVMDEPCQQSMKEESLKRLFSACADVKDKQIILFCSSQPKTEENNNNESNDNVIDKLLNQLNRNDINEIQIGVKSIKPLEN